MWESLAVHGAASYNNLYFSDSEGLYKDIECANDTSTQQQPGDANDTSTQQQSGDVLGAGTANAPQCHSNSKDGELSVQTAQSLPLFLGLPKTDAGECCACMCVCR